MNRRPRIHPDGEVEFEELFRPLFTQAYRVARRILGEPAVAEDVAAEAMSRAYAHWGRICELPYRDAWVLRVTTNLALNVARRRPVVLRPTDESAADDAVANRMALVAALATLPERQREVVVLRHLAGFSEREVAARLGITLGTVKTHLTRGRTALRQRYDADLSELQVHGT